MDAQGGDGSWSGTWGHRVGMSDAERLTGRQHHLGHGRLDAITAGGHVHLEVQLAWRLRLKGQPPQAIGRP